MQQFFENRYVQLTILTLAIGTAIWAIFWLILFLLNIKGFPILLQMTVGYLGAGVLVAKYLAGRVA